MPSDGKERHRRKFPAEIYLTRRAATTFLNGRALIGPIDWLLDYVMWFDGAPSGSTGRVRGNTPLATASQKRRRAQSWKGSTGSFASYFYLAIVARCRRSKPLTTQVSSIQPDVQTRTVGKIPTASSCPDVSGAAVLRPAPAPDGSPTLSRHPLGSPGKMSVSTYARTGWRRGRKASVIWATGGRPPATETPTSGMEEGDMPRPQAPIVVPI